MENENITPETSEQQTAPQTAPQAAPQRDTNLRTFTQEQLDAIIARERTKATKGWFSAEQMQAKETSITTLTNERDAARSDLEKTRAELEGLKNEKFLSGKGVPADMLEFYAFKIGKMVADGKTFEQAAEEYLKENPPAGEVRVSTGGKVGGSSPSKPQKPNDIMNALIRGANKE